MGVADPGPPGARPHAGRRDHDRPARPGPRQRGRHGHGGPARARAVRPGRRPGHQPVRPPRLRDLLRRRHRGGHQPRGQRHRRPPEAGQPRRDLGRQPDLDRGRHQRRQVRGRGGPLRGVRLARPARRLARRGRLPRGRRRPCTTRWSRPRRRPAGRRSSRCGRSSAGRRRTSRTPARSTARRSAPTRSPRPSRSSASTRTARSRSTTTVLGPRPGGGRPRPRGPRASGSRSSTPGPRPTRSAGSLLDRLLARELPEGWTSALPEFPADPKGMATRKASGEVLNAIAPVLPELWGGSADLAERNNTTIEGEPSFVPPEHSTKVVPGRLVRPDPPLRNPRARHGRDPQRHRPARRHPPVRRARSWSSATTCARRCGWPR